MRTDELLHGLAPTINFAASGKALSGACLHDGDVFRAFFHLFLKLWFVRVFPLLLLSLTGFVLTQWGHLAVASHQVSDWGQAARITMETFFKQLVLLKFMREIEHLQDLILSCGFPST